MQKTNSLNTTRRRLAKLRDELCQRISGLKTSSTIFKLTKGRLTGVYDAIDICDQELLAQEQGEPTELRPDQVAWLVKRRAQP